MAVNLLESSLDGLAQWLDTWGEPGYRARQVYRQLYVKRVETPAEMTDLPQALRERMTRETRTGDLEVVRVQEGDEGLTRKVLFRSPGGDSIETVLMIYPDRATVCVSTQAGCAMGCIFCATGKLGLLSNLTAGQMVEQVLWAARTVKAVSAARPGEGLPEEISNVVFMGMGEAFNNYKPWWTAVERLHDPEGFNLGARSFTVSTVGLVPGIRRLAKAALPVNLAISLHAADDDLRSELMPVNKAYPIADLLAATRDYVQATNRRVSFEVVLLEGKNDDPEQAGRMAKVLRHGPLADVPQLIHVNLIPWNQVPGTPLARSSRHRVLAFQTVLKSAGVPCTVRVERGVEIDAACGQLAGH
jgi:23S rRNA (adenine2503-C2)-methyltransferase